MLLIKFRIVALLMLFAGSSLMVHAETVHAVQGKSCVDEVVVDDNNQLKWIACAAEEIEKLDQELFELHDTMSMRHSPGQISYLVSASAAWQHYRHNWCSYLYVTNLEPKHYNGYSECMIEYTKLHIEQIKQHASANNK